MNQIPSSGRTSSGGGSSTRHGSGGTGHRSCVAATSFSVTSPSIALLEFVSVAAPILSAGET